jgi:hypothetical protein
MRRPDKRFYEAARERPFLVARICGYLRRGKDCDMCGEETMEGETYQPACRLLAEEAVAVVLEAVEQGPEQVRQDR